MPCSCCCCCSSSVKCSSGAHFRRLGLSNPRSGFANVFAVRTMRTLRVNDLFIRASRLSSRSKHKLAGKSLKDGCGITRVLDHSKLLSKVSAVVGYDGFHEFIENEDVEIRPSGNIRDDADVFDAELARKRFPSINIGSSPQVKLYDETTHCCDMRSIFEAEGFNGFLPSVPGVNWVGDGGGIYEQWCSAPVILNATSSSTTEELIVDNSSMRSKFEEEISLSPNKSIGDGSAYDTFEIKDKLACKISMEESASKVGPDSQINVAFLDSAISCISELSKRQFLQLENCGFHTLRKLLHHFPRTYADLQNLQTGIEDGQYLLSVGEIVSSRGVRAGQSFSFLEVIVSCEIAETQQKNMIDEPDKWGKATIYLHLKKFFRGTRFASQPFLRILEDKHKVGDVVCVSGKVRTMHSENHYEMREYHIDVLKDVKESSLHSAGRPHPIYPSKGGLNADVLREIISKAIEALPDDIDPIPKEITQEFGLLHLRDAYCGIHQPRNVEEADLARKRLIFDEFFYLQLGRLFQMLEGLGSRVEKDGLLDKYRKPELNAVYMEDWSSLTKKFMKAVPYSLTSSQLSAISEIIWDLKRPVPMNRLLQGDVGCGKTVVAFLACMEVIGSGYQAAFMVPTELLAIQHYHHLCNLLESMEDQSKPSVALLTGSTPAKQSRMIRQDIQNGNISMVIGTHSLISDRLEFSALRIAVVDEQHRFGVIQRGRFNSKLYLSLSGSKVAPADSDGSSKPDVYMAPHVLALSATPIPRTLALALYGDMSLTQITDLPPGRIPVETCIIEGNSNGFEDVYKMMLDELQVGGKVYLVYPVIEQSEQLPQLRAASADLETISKRFPDYKCGLLHGRMKGDEKDEALSRFRSGETQVLLSTQIIEIGVDVPDASMMVVMNSERFGIAQLHQLRGRVGRGTRKSRCILVASTSSSLTRLKILEKSTDGFYLANMDLLLRGPGDLLGKKQSGHLPEFPIARLEIDGNILQEAHAAALKILGDSHDLEKFPALKTELSMRQPLCLLGD